MVKYKNIIKAIDNHLTKCSITAPLKKLGASGVWSEGTDEYGNPTKILTYDDGTVLTFSAFEDMDGELLTVKDSTHFISFYGDEDFREQEDWIHETFGYGEYEFFKEYVHYKSSTIGMAFNEYLRGDLTKEGFIDKCKWLFPKPYESQYSDFEMFRNKDGEYMANFLIDNNDHFQELCKLSYQNREFATLRGVNKLHDNDNLDKRIVSDKGYTSASVGMSLNTMGQVLELEPDCWKIITKYKRGNKANKGLYLGDASYENWGFDDWDEFLTAPGDKFIRTHIDLKNKIIIQEPYEP